MPPRGSAARLGLFERADPIAALARRRVLSTAVRRENNHGPAYRATLRLACGHEVVQVFKVARRSGRRGPEEVARPGREGRRDGAEERAWRAAARLCEAEESPCPACGPADE